jgi:hypothetical protein
MKTNTIPIVEDDPDTAEILRISSLLAGEKEALKLDWLLEQISLLYPFLSAAKQILAADFNAKTPRTQRKQTKS